MKEVKELVIGTRYWLDGFKNVSGVYVGNMAYTDIEGDDSSYIYNPDGTIGFLRIGDVSIKETDTLLEANPLKAMAEEQYCNTNWAVIKYITALEEQINYQNQQV
jgi:hypothetical protein